MEFLVMWMRGRQESFGIARMRAMVGGTIVLAKYKSYNNMNTMQWLEKYKDGRIQHTCYKK